MTDADSATHPAESTKQASAVISSAEGEEAAAQNIIQWMTNSWALVEDSGTAAVYYWNSQTNDVSWELPAGTQPLDSDPAGHAAQATTPEATAAPPLPEATGIDPHSLKPPDGTSGGGADAAPAATDVAAPRSASEPQPSHLHTSTVSPTATATTARPDDTHATATAPPTHQDADGSTAGVLAIEGQQVPARHAEHAGSVSHGDTSPGGPRLPPGWVRVVDEESGLPYYWHEESNNTQWEAPDFPAADVAADGRCANSDDGGAGFGAADGAAMTREGGAETLTVRDTQSMPADAAAAAAVAGSSNDAVGGRAAGAARGSSGKGRALAARAALAHARASAALSDALLATAQRGGAAELPFLHAELLVRQGDLAALRGALKEAAAAVDDEGSAPALSVEAVVAVCRHVEGHVRGVSSRAAAATAAAATLGLGGTGKAGGVGAGSTAAATHTSTGPGAGNISGAAISKGTLPQQAVEVEDGEVEDAAARGGDGAATASWVAGKEREAGNSGQYMHETHAVSPWAQALHAAMVGSGGEAVDPLVLQVGDVVGEEPPPLPEGPPPEEPPPGLEEEHAAMEGADSVAAPAEAAPLPLDEDDEACVGVQDRPLFAASRNTAADAEVAPAGSAASGSGKVAEAVGDDGDAGARKRRRGPPESASASAAGGSAKKPKKLRGRTSKLLDKWHNVARELEAEEVRGRPLLGCLSRRCFCALSTAPDSLRCGAMNAVCCRS